MKFLAAISIMATAAVLAASAAGATEPVAPAPVQAATQPGKVYRLTPEQIAGINADPTPQPPLTYDALFDKSLFPSPDDAAPRRDRKMHGEVGAFVGSDGSRGVFGATTVPLGDTGSASFSFENSRYGDDRRRRYRY